MFKINCSLNGGYEETSKVLDLGKSRGEREVEKEEGKEKKKKKEGGRRKEERRRKKDRESRTIILL